MTAHTSIGLVGAGNVGGRIARDLVAAGYRVLVLDPSETALLGAEADGARRAGSCGQLAEEAEVVLLSLPNSATVEAVTRGSDGLLAHLRDGHVLVDMSTSLPSRTAELALLCNASGINLVDAPISFGPHGMDVMVGADQETFETIRPLLEAFSHRVTLVGPSGHGHYAKLVQNLISGVNIAVIAEAVALASKAGLDPMRVFEAIRTSAASVNQLEYSLPRMISHDFGQGGQLALHTKDMRYVLETARELGAVTPLSEALLAVFSGALAGGDALWGQAASIRYYEERMSIDVRMNAHQASED